MRSLIRASALTLVLAAISLPGAVTPALAKKPKLTPCTGRFLVDSGQALLPEACGTVDALDVTKDQVTVADTCSAPASLRATRPPSSL